MLRRVGQIPGKRELAGNNRSGAERRKLKRFVLAATCQTKPGRAPAVSLPGLGGGGLGLGASFQCSGLNLR